MLVESRPDWYSSSRLRWWRGMLWRETDSFICYWMNIRGISDWTHQLTSASLAAGTAAVTMATASVCRLDHDVITTARSISSNGCYQPAPAIYRSTWTPLNCVVLLALDTAAICRLLSSYICTQLSCFDWRSQTETRPASNRRWLVL